MIHFSLWWHIKTFPKISGDLSNCVFGYSGGVNGIVAGLGRSFSTEDDISNLLRRTIIDDQIDVLGVSNWKKMVMKMFLFLIFLENWTSSWQRRIVWKAMRSKSHLWAFWNSNSPLDSFWRNVDKSFEVKMIEYFSRKKLLKLLLLQT